MSPLSQAWYIVALVCSSGIPVVFADNGVGGPADPAAFGNMISTAVWQSEYDFVVKLRINKDGRTYLCTGIVWKAKILTSAHCAQKQDDSFVAPTAITAHTANRAFSITAMDVHPKYLSDNADYMILTMSEALSNRRAIAFKATDNAIGTRLMLAAMGTTAHDDANALFPARPVLTTYMSTSTCHWNEFANCIGSGPTSRQASCGGDSGGPWLQWREEVAVIAGVNSFGYGSGECGHADAMTGFAPTSAVHDWIEQVAPGYFPWTDSTYVKLTTGWCPAHRQVSKEECLAAAKSIGAAASKTQLGGHDSGMGGRPQGCTLHRRGNVEWWGPSDNAPCGSLNYDCVCKMLPVREPAEFIGCKYWPYSTSEGVLTFDACQRRAKEKGSTYFGLNWGNHKQGNHGGCQVQASEPSGLSGAACQGQTDDIGTYIGSSQNMAWYQTDPARRRLDAVSTVLV